MLSLSMLDKYLESFSNVKAGGSGEDDLLQQALALSLTQQDEKAGSSVRKMPDLSSMTEEEQLHYALQMSMAATEATTSAVTTGPSTSSASSSTVEQMATDKQASADAEMKEVHYLFSCVRMCVCVCDVVEQFPLYICRLCSDRRTRTMRRR